MQTHVVMLFEQTYKLLMQMKLRWVPETLFVCHSLIFQAFILDSWRFRNVEIESLSSGLALQSCNTLRKPNLNFSQ